MENILNYFKEKNMFLHIIWRIIIYTIVVIISLNVGKLVGYSLFHLLKWLNIIEVLENFFDNFLFF